MQRGAGNSETRGNHAKATTHHSHLSIHLDSSNPKLRSAALALIRRTSSPIARSLKSSMSRRFVMKRQIGSQGKN